MPVVGTPQLWSHAFPARLIPDIVVLVEDSWKTFDQPSRDELENNITRSFRCHLMQRKNALRSLPVRISRESVEDDPKTGAEKGRIDIRFVYVFNCRENVYFAFECKRLNVPKRRTCKTLAAEYLDKGVLRFVTSQYAATLRHGGMIGYVMNGDIDHALAAINRCIAARRRRLRMNTRHVLSESLMIRGRPAVKETFHQLDNRLFRIQHVFLRVD